MMAGERKPFVWHTFDVTPCMPEGWQERILEVAGSSAKYRELIPKSVTSREISESIIIPVNTVGGVVVSESLPWLHGLYSGLFRDLAQLISEEPVVAAEDLRYGINLNVQRGKQHRYECHVDSNPIEGLLYVTDHPKGMGGELILSNYGDVRGKESIDLDATKIYPVAGHLIFFDARQFTHYVAPLSSDYDVRVVAAMNFYTPSCPESARPADLNRHLFGVD